MPGKTPEQMDADKLIKDIEETAGDCTPRGHRAISAGVVYNIHRSSKLPEVIEQKIELAIPRIAIAVTNQINGTLADRVIKRLATEGFIIPKSSQNGASQDDKGRMSMEGWGMKFGLSSANMAATVSALTLSTKSMVATLVLRLSGSVTNG